MMREIRRKDRVLEKEQARELLQTGESAKAKKND